MKKYLITAVILVFAIFSQAQTVSFPIDYTCITDYSYQGCPTFENHCPGDGWTSSHGSPQMIQVELPGSRNSVIGYEALMIANAYQSSEGMFYRYNFQNGKTYDVTITYALTGNGVLRMYAANTLNEDYHNCQGRPQWVAEADEQEIGIAPSSPWAYTTATYRFTADNDFTQFWMYPWYNSGKAAHAYVRTITVTPICTLPAPSGLTTAGSGKTLTWDPVPGAQSYDLTIEDTYNGSTTTVSANTVTNSHNYCPRGTGSVVTFHVKARCDNYTAGPASQHTYTYNQPYSSPITGLNVVPSANSATVTWDAQSPGTSYYGMIYGSVYYDWTSNTNSVTFTGLAPYTTYTFTVNAYGNCGPVHSVTSTFTTTGCPTPGAPYVQSAQSKLWVYFPTRPTGVNYANLKYREYGSSTETVIPNVLASETFVFQGTPGKVYEFAVQWICPNNTLSQFGPWSSPAGQYRLKLPAPKKESPQEGITFDSLQAPKNVSEKSLIIYPNPASKELNISVKKPAGVAYFTITDVMGKVVMKKEFSIVAKKQNQFTLDISKLPNGIYVLQYKTGETYLTEKFVVKRTE